MKKTYHTRYCGGRSRKTGKRVGSRHRWLGDPQCQFCGRFRDQVRVLDVDPRQGKLLK